MKKVRFQVPVFQRTCAVIKRCTDLLCRPSEREFAQSRACWVHTLESHWHLFGDFVISMWEPVHASNSQNTSMIRCEDRVRDTSISYSMFLRIILQWVEVYRTVLVVTLQFWRACIYIPYAKKKCNISRECRRDLRYHVKTRQYGYNIAPKARLFRAHTWMAEESICGCTFASVFLGGIPWFPEKRYPKSVGILNYSALSHHSLPWM